MVFKIELKVMAVAVCLDYFYGLFITKKTQLALGLANFMLKLHPMLHTFNKEGS